MVTPTTSEEDSEEPLDNAWIDDEEDDESVEEADESEELDGEAEIATADVHDGNVRVDDDVGDINNPSSSDLSDAEIEDVDETNDDELDVETADIGEDDVDDSKFGFDGEEDASGDVEEEDEEANVGEDMASGGDLESAINDGVASLGVIGIEDDETQEKLREDFQDTAESFRLGYYAEECVQEYFLGDDVDDISPVWGLVFASLVCAAVFALQRPDTEEIGGKVTDAIDGIGEGLGGASS